MLRQGLDIGGTKIEAAVPGNAEEIAYRPCFPTAKQNDEPFFNTVIAIIQQVQPGSRNR